MPTFPTENNLDILQSISDTLNVIGPKVNQIAEASDPETVQLNLTMAIIAAVSGVMGVVFGFLGYLYSKRTAKNVERTNKENRLRISDRLIQIVYRKMVYVRTLLNDRPLISQNILRSIYLPKFEDCFILEDYRNDAERYNHLLSLKNQMTKYDSVIDACIDKLNAKEALTDRDFLDLLETPVKVLIELFHFNNEKSNNYADHLICTIIDYHFDHVKGDTLAKFENISFSPSSESDIGMSLFMRLCQQGPMESSRALLCKNNNEGLRQRISTYLDKDSVDLYMNHLAQSVAQDDVHNTGIIAWLSAAWALDSAIVQQQFRNYYETAI